MGSVVVFGWFTNLRLDNSLLGANILQRVIIDHRLPRHLIPTLNSSSPVKFVHLIESLKLVPLLHG